jgi:hypothetical protein
VLPEEQSGATKALKKEETKFLILRTGEGGIKDEVKCIDYGWIIYFDRCPDGNGFNCSHADY